MANAKENVILQGYAVTGVTAFSEQKIITQGYGPDVTPPPVGGGGVDIIVLTMHGHMCCGTSILRS